MTHDIYKHKKFISANFYIIFVLLNLLIFSHGKSWSQRKFTFNYVQFEKENLDKYRVLKDFQYPDTGLQEDSSPSQPIQETPILLPEGSMGLTIDSDTLIPALVERHKYLNKQIESIDGFRVQIFASSRRHLAQQQRSKFDVLYPEVRSYLNYEDPYFKIRVGDFIRKREADIFNNEISGDFPASFVLGSKVLPPKMLEE